MALFLILFLDESRSNIGNVIHLPCEGERVNADKAIELASEFKTNPDKLKQIIPCPPQRLNYGLVLVEDVDLVSWHACNTLDQKREWWASYMTKQSLVVAEVINTRKRA